MSLEDFVKFQTRHSLFQTSRLIPVTEAATKAAMSELRQSRAVLGGASGVPTRLQTAGQKTAGQKTLGQKTLGQTPRPALRPSRS